MTGEQTVHKVDPERLASGTWSHEFNKQVGEGDIARSYSADRIGSDGSIRQPFIFGGELWVNVGQSKGITEAYRLMPLDGEVQTTYTDKVTNSAAARADSLGFYHGMAIRYGSDWFVMTGPAAQFIPGPVLQPGLFGGPK